MSKQLNGGTVRGTRVHDKDGEPQYGLVKVTAEGLEPMGRERKRLDLRTLEGSNLLDPDYHHKALRSSAD